MPYAVVVMLLQIGCIVHVVKTGRSRLWILALVLLPVAGAVAYVLAEIVPELFNTRTAHDLKRSAKIMIDPEGDLRRLSERLEIADTPENRRGYAMECLRLGRAAEAIAALEPALAGPHADDTALHVDLAAAHFEQGDAQRALDLLDRVKRIDPH